MRDILLATRNPSKAREMLEILAAGDWPRLPVQGGGGEAPRVEVRWRRLSEFEGWPEPAEVGETFRANAELKAQYYARLSGLWTVADDSGLEVDILNGEPGTRSARFAGEPRDDQANNRLLIQRLSGVPPERRTARFRCVGALSDGRRILATGEGTVEGQIVDQPRGGNGFGYDPHFLIPSAGMTAAEMSPRDKHAISHRGQALRRLRAAMTVLLTEG